MIYIVIILTLLTLVAIFIPAAKFKKYAQVLIIITTLLGVAAMILLIWKFFTTVLGV